MKRGSWPALLGASALAAALAAWMNARPPAARPQRTSGEDALSVAFGDAKATIGRALVQKADSYFHGGADLEGPHDCLHHGHGDHEHGHAHGPDAGRPHSAFDPWRWINAHIRAPQIERHLEGKKAVELIPWLWAAVRANPRDTDTWTTAWYVAARQMKDDALALEIAREATRANPDAPDVACALGRSYRAAATCDPARAQAAFQRARTLVLKKADRSAQDEYAFFEALNYLSVLRPDAASIRSLLADARTVNPRHTVTRALEDRLRNSAAHP